MSVKNVLSNFVSQVLGQKNCVNNLTPDQNNLRSTILDQLFWVPTFWPPTTKLWGQICHRQKAVGHTLDKYLTS